MILWVRSCRIAVTLFKGLTRVCSKVTACGVGLLGAGPRWMMMRWRWGYVDGVLTVGWRQISRTCIRYFVNITYRGGEGVEELHVSRHNNIYDVLKQNSELMGVRGFSRRGTVPLQLCFHVSVASSLPIAWDSSYEEIALTSYYYVDLSTLYQPDCDLEGTKRQHFPLYLFLYNWFM